MKIYFISHGPTAELINEQLIDGFNAGVDFLQLRAKNMEVSSLRQILEALPSALRREALIINDFPELAAEFDCLGAHVGREDTEPLRARRILGPQRILGVTINSLDEARAMNWENVDYAGIGPYHFTRTKTKLSAVLAPKELAAIVDSIPEQVEKFLIGGIGINDMDAIRKLAVSGVAISGSLLKNGHFDRQALEQFRRTN